MAAKEFRMQLYFGDDNTFEFVKREVAFSCFVVRMGDKLIKAWKHFFSCQLPFPGYNRMPAGQVSLAYSRDIILDPFNMVPTGTTANEKPTPGSDNLKKWIANIAENMRNIYRGKRESYVWTSRITWAFLGVLGVMVLMWGIAYGAKIYVR